VEELMKVRFLAWQGRNTAIFGVTWTDPRTGGTIAVNAPLEADPERLAATQSLPEHVLLDVIAGARRLAHEFSVAIANK
jgi:hypothetical protein